MKNKIYSSRITSCKVVNPDNGSKEKSNTKCKYSIIGILILVFSFTIFASVAIHSYNSYIMASKNKIALNFATMAAQSANVYYSQNQTTPVFGDLNIRHPLGYTAILNGTAIDVSGDGSPGYGPRDFNQQSVDWKW